MIFVALDRNGCVVAVETVQEDTPDALEALGRLLWEGYRVVESERPVTLGEVFRDGTPQP